MKYDKANFAIAKMAGAESRFNINGILVTPQETVVTDGTRLTVMKNEESAPEAPDFNPYIMPSGFALAIAKQCNKKSEVHLDDVEDGADIKAIKAVVDGQIALNNNKLGGSFPDYKRVIPNIEEGYLRVRVNIKLLQGILEAHALVGNTIDLVISEKNAHISPVVLETQPRAKSILMPMSQK